MRKVYQDISLGQEVPYLEKKKERWILVLKTALGQGRMNKKPLVGVLHFFVYIGFFIINLELFEIIIDGIFGTHRFFFSIFGSKVYSYFTAILESFSLLTIIAVAIFFIRRNFIKYLIYFI